MRLVFAPELKHTGLIISEISIVLAIVTLGIAEAAGILPIQPTL